MSEIKPTVLVGSKFFSPKLVNVWVLVISRLYTELALCSSRMVDVEYKKF